MLPIIAAFLKGGAEAAGAGIAQRVMGGGRQQMPFMPAQFSGSRLPSQMPYMGMGMYGYGYPNPIAQGISGGVGSLIDQAFQLRRPNPVPPNYQPPVAAARPQPSPSMVYGRADMPNAMILNDPLQAGWGSRTNAMEGYQLF